MRAAPFKFIAVAAKIFFFLSVSAHPEITGEFKKWHKLTLTFIGPHACENDQLNPFLDFRLQIKFKNEKNQEFLVNGFFAADGNAAETSASCGDKWRVNFLPSDTGKWNYEVFFVRGENISVTADSGIAVLPLHGFSDSFFIAPTDKSGKDFRSMGLLRYVGEHYLQFAETGEYFLKGGADSPENFLGYFEFDQTYNLPGGTMDTSLQNGLHRYQPHVQDWKSTDPQWQNGKGKGIIGALNYLASQGGNSVYFLTYNINGGDGRDTWMWAHPDDKKRFDCSKLDQWEIVFQHMDSLGIQLHVITQETENDTKIDSGKLGLHRKLYYRELVSRFAHHHALQWNLGEENTNSITDLKNFAQYIRSIDPYDHPITFHIFNDEIFRYDEVYGDENFECSSLQNGFLNSYNNYAKILRERSDSAGRKWVIYGDEQETEVNPDLSNLNTLRRAVLWGNLMGGGAGVEWYFGYQNNFGDIVSEDWRVVEPLWRETFYAINFFQEHLPFHEMSPRNDLLSNSLSFCFAKADEVYAVYIPANQSNTIDLPNSLFRQKWFSPTTDTLITGNIINGKSDFQISLPPFASNQDWVTVLHSINSSEIPVIISIKTPLNGASFSAPADVQIEAEVISFSNEIQHVEFFLDSVKINEDFSAPYFFTVNDLTAGSYEIYATVFYNDSLSVSSQKVTVSISEEDIPEPSIFVLINALTDNDIKIMYDGDVINLFNTGKDLSIRTDFNLPNIGSVYFNLNGNSQYQKENIAPYAIRGDNTGNYNSWTPPLGNHILIATAWSQANGKGNILSSDTVNFTVIDRAEDCNGTPGGTAEYDDCGICSGGMTGKIPNADKDCFGNCFQNAKIDSCGVCGGDNSSCRDCAGVIGGSAEIDDCEVCAGGTTGKIPNKNKDCSGECFGMAFLDSCGSCVLGNTGLEEFPFLDCAGECFGEAFIDSCGVCVGGNTGLAACVKDCNGDFGGTAFLDSCEICSGGNSGHEANSDIDDCGECLGNNENKDCNGECFGDAFIDGCGNCVGGNSGLSACPVDCNGDAFGLAFIDSCGVCSGGNSGHEPNSDIDDCGVCLGNNEDKDCNGECFGKAFIDDCNICASGSTGKIANQNKDCNGVCFGQAFIDSCGNCVGGSTGHIPCVQDCNGVYGGNAFFDDCNICSGGNTGKIPNAEKDDCGICSGNNENKDCNSVCFGKAFLDDCGECVGGNTGKIANSKKDRCGVCFGDGSTCINCALAIVSFTIVKAGTAGDISELKNGAVINLHQVKDISVRANECKQPIGSVRFVLNGSNFQTESQAPYAIKGDNNGSYNKWNVSPGNYTLTAIPYSKANAAGTTGDAYTISFTVINQAVVLDCNGDVNGTAFLDDCRICSGGNTGHVANFDKDRCGVCFGDNSTCCTTSLECNDNDVCTSDSCISNECVFISKNCDDNNACTVDVCENGECINLYKTCNDNDPCTNDTCDVQQGCVFTKISGCCSKAADCNDNNACTIDICENGNCIYAAGSAEPPFLKIQNPNRSWRKLKLAYGSSNLWSSYQNVTAGGNDKMCITLRVKSGNVEWAKMEIRPQGSSSATVKLNNYINTNVAAWAEICIPLSAFKGFNFSNISFIEIPYSNGANAFEIDIQKIIFTGGSTSFLWFGNEKTDNYHDGKSGSGSALPASIVAGNPCAANKSSSFEPVFQKIPTPTLHAFPNPFSDEVNIQFSIAHDSKVRLEILNVEGKILSMIFEGDAKANEIHSHRFYAKELSSGMYFYRLICSSGIIENKKLLLVK